MTVPHTLTFDASPSARSTDENGFLHVASSHITKATVNPYYGREIPGWREAGLDPEAVYYGFRDPEELKKSLSTWQGLPLHIEHHVDSAEEPARLTRVGAVGRADWNAPLCGCAFDRVGRRGHSRHRRRLLPRAFLRVPLRP